MEENNTKKAKEQDYYLGNTKRKIIDFCIGFFGLLFLEAIYLGINILLSFNFSGQGFFIMTLSSIWRLLGLAVFVFSILFCIKMFKINRRYIGIGMIAFYILFPLVFFGACFVMLYNFQV